MGSTFIFALQELNGTKVKNKIYRKRFYMTPSGTRQLISDHIFSWKSKREQLFLEEK